MDSVLAVRGCSHRSGGLSPRGRDLRTRVICWEAGQERNSCLLWSIGVCVRVRTAIPSSNQDQETTSIASRMPVPAPAQPSTVCLRSPFAPCTLFCSPSRPQISFHWQAQSHSPLLAALPCPHWSRPFAHQPSSPAADTPNHAHDGPPTATCHCRPGASLPVLGPLHASSLGRTRPQPPSAPPNRDR